MDPTETIPNAVRAHVGFPLSEEGAYAALRVAGVPSDTIALYLMRERVRNTPSQDFWAALERVSAPPSSAPPPPPASPPQAASPLPAAPLRPRTPPPAEPQPAQPRQPTPPPPPSAPISPQAGPASAPASPHADPAPGSDEAPQRVSQPVIPPAPARPAGGGKRKRTTCAVCDGDRSVHHDDMCYNCYYARRTRELVESGVSCAICSATDTPALRFHYPLGGFMCHACYALRLALPNTPRWNQAVDKIRAEKGLPPLHSDEPAAQADAKEPSAPASSDEVSEFAPEDMPSDHSEADESCEPEAGEEVDRPKKVTGWACRVCGKMTFARPRRYMCRRCYGRDRAARLVARGVRCSVCDTTDTTEFASDGKGGYQCHSCYMRAYRNRRGPTRAGRKRP